MNLLTYNTGLIANSSGMPEHLQKCGHYKLELAQAICLTAGMYFFKKLAGFIAIVIVYLLHSTIHTPYTVGVQLFYVIALLLTNQLPITLFALQRVQKV